MDGCVLFSIDAGAALIESEEENGIEESEDDERRGSEKVLDCKRAVECVVVQ